MKHFVKRAISVTVCLVLIGIVNVYGSEPNFSDMKGHWAEKYVMALEEKGIISGMEDGLFHPDLPVTISQFTAMIMRSGYGDIAPINKYWASGYLDAAYKKEVVIANDIEKPDQPLERRYAARIGHEALLKIFNEADEQDVSVADSLGDLYSCRTCVWHVAQCYTKGIMLGRPDSLFHNEEFLTRAEAAIVIMKIIDPSLRDKPLKPKTASPQIFENGIISPNEALRILQYDKTAMLIDVRSKEEYKTGYIQGSICVPLPDILDNLAGTEIPADKNTVIIVYCQKGSRTIKAISLLKEAGYVNVYNLGGIEAWPYDIVTTNN